MPGMTRPATARPEEEAILGRPRRTAFLTVGVVALTAVLFALAAGHGTMARIQRLDDAWLRLMISGRAPPLTAIAKVFNVLGLVYVTLPVRIALAAYLALRRRWWHLAAFTAAVVVSEVLIGTSCALLTALVAGLLQRRRQQRGRSSPQAQRLTAAAPPDHAGRGRRRLCWRSLQHRGYV